MSTNSSDTLLELPTELLIRIFAHLQVEDLLSVQHTCRRFRDVISGSVSLQYFLHTEINLLEDLSLPDFSLCDRVALLKHHETAWNNLQLNEFTRFLTNEESHPRCYILQDGYLIYKAVTDTTQYGYLDLYSNFTRPNAEAPWTHISLGAIRPLSDIVFAVDHNLVVSIRSEQYSHAVSFAEFTTGAHHPLALRCTIYPPIHTVFCCKKPEVEVLGDYLLMTAVDEMWARSTFSVISWKTGMITRLRHLLGAVRVVVIDPDNSLIALIKCATNSIEICKLQFESRQPCLHSLCFLRLPIFKYTNPISVFTSGMEWIRTSKPQDRTRSQTSRGQSFPFCPYRAGTIALTLGYGDDVCQYSMIISIGALLSVAHSGVRHVPWADWGPAGTRIRPFGNCTLPRPAGPFWITSYAPFLVVHDYDPLRARYMKMSEASIPYNPSSSSLGPPSTKLFGEHWIEGEVRTHLPFRMLIADGLFLKHVVQVVADREWIVMVSRTRPGERTSITVYHVG